jgi:hypothetical protein
MHPNILSTSHIVRFTLRARIPKYCLRPNVCRISVEPLFISCRIISPSCSKRLPDVRFFSSSFLASLDSRNNLENNPRTGQLMYQSQMHKRRETRIPYNPYVCFQVTVARRYITDPSDFCVNHMAFWAPSASFYLSLIAITDRLPLPDVKIYGRLANVRVPTSVRGGRDFLPRKTANGDV